MQGYTTGFAFYNQQVFLIHKNRGPRDVVGRLNGIGGKMEPGETPAHCQSREFLEEAGVLLPPERWEHVATLYGDDWACYFFATEVTPDEAEEITTMEDEPIACFDPLDVMTLNVVPNLRWLLPLALDGRVDKPLRIKYKEG